MLVFLSREIMLASIYRHSGGQPQRLRRCDWADRSSLPGNTLLLADSSFPFSRHFKFQNSVILSEAKDLIMTRSFTSLRMTAYFSR